MESNIDIHDDDEVPSELEARQVWCLSSSQGSGVLLICFLGFGALGR
jgi:hypothetical protein